MPCPLLPRTSRIFTLAPVGAALAITLAASACTSTTTVVQASPEAGPVDSELPGADAEAEASVTAPPDAGPDGAATRKRVFVTSALTRGNMGGTKGGDAFCQAAATKAKLGGTFRALLVTDGSVATAPLAEVGPFYLVDRETEVSPTVSKLAAVIEHPIDQMEDGQPVPASRLVWTGALATCGNWATTNPYDNGSVGLASSLAEFGNHGSVACVDGSASLYCFEQ